MKYLILILFCVYTGLNAQSGYFVQSNDFAKSEVKYFAKLTDCDLAICNDKLIFKYPDNRIIEINFTNSNVFNFQLLNNNKSKLNIIKGKNKNKISYQTFDSILIKNIYNGIDLKLKLKDKRLVYEFLVDKLANSEDIKMNIVGSDATNIIDNNLELTIGKNKVIHKNLAIITNEDKSLQECNFIQNNQKAIQFNSKVNNNITIDPIIYSTYLGGTGYDFGMGIIKDKSNNTYITGYTNSFDFPYSENAFRREFKENPTGESDAFISKYDSNGVLLYSTFFGGFTEDKSVSIALDTNENVVITGYVKKTETFPTTTKAIDSTHNGGYDIFIAKFDSTLSKLLFSTLLGSTKDDYSSTILIDKENNYIVCGNTSQVLDSIPFPVTGELNNNIKGKIDLFLLKLNEKGDSLIFSTLFGGNEDDFAQDMTLISNDNVWITGSTRSKNFPTTSDAFKKTNNDNLLDSASADGFYSLINLSSFQIVHSSYLGGNRRDIPYSVALDTNSNLYICGSTESSDFPILSAYDSNYENAIDSKGKGDAFITKINSVNYQLDYSTYLGGSGSDRAFDICIDTIGNAYVTGYTFSKNFPITKKALKKSLIDTSQSDGFLIKLSNDGKKLLYSTYIGGNNFDICKSMICDKYSNFYITGGTASMDFPVTPNANDTLLNVTLKSDVFFTQLKLAKEDFGTEDNLFGCANNVSVLSSIYTQSSNTFGIAPYTYKWSPNLYLDFDDVVNPVCISPTSITYTFIMTDSNGESFYDTIPVNIVNTQKPEISGYNIVLNGYSEVYTTKSYPGFKYKWFASGGDVTAGQGTNTATITFFNTISGAVYCSLFNDYGCADTSLPLFVFILPNNDPKVLISKGKLKKCEADTLILDCGPGFKSVIWSDGTSGRLNYAFKSGKYWFKALNLANKFVYSDTITVIASQSPAKPIIRYTDGVLRCLSLNVGYQWYYNNVKIPNGKDRQQVKVGNGTYYCDVINGSCSNRSDFIVVNDTFGLGSIETLNDEFVNIFPNPTNGVFYMNFTESPKLLSIFNELGEKILIRNSIGNSEIIDLTNHTQGVYFLKVEYNYLTKFYKIILINSF